MRKKFYNSIARFVCNDIVEINSRLTSFSDVEELVDRSYFVPSTEAVKRIRNLGNLAMDSLYDSELAIKAGITPEFVRHPSRDIVEVQKFTDQLYQKVEQSLQNDLTVAQRKILENEKKSLEKTRIQLEQLNTPEDLVKKE